MTEIFSEEDRQGHEGLTEFIQGVPKNLLESREQYIVVSRFSSVFPGV